MPKVPSYMLDGKKIDHYGFVDPDIPIDSYLDEKAGVIQSFTDRNAFVKSFMSEGFKANIQDAVNKLDGIKATYAKMDNKQIAAFEAKQAAEFSSKQQAIRQLLKRKGISPKDHAALFKLHQDGKIGSMIVCDSTGWVGSWIYFPPVFWPKLSWFGWNDRISSFYNIGVLASFHQHTWFGGHCLWIPPFAAYRNLADYGWNNRTSSIIIHS